MAKKYSEHLINVVMVSDSLVLVHLCQIPTMTCACACDYCRHCPIEVAYRCVTEIHTFSPVCLAIVIVTKFPERFHEKNDLTKTKYSTL